MMKTINAKDRPKELKRRALVRALAWMMADRFVDQRRRAWQEAFHAAIDAQRE
ncbi:hypothetical protein [Bradyrhizobium sp. CCBAU 11434]|uniref:hypothetical protein n=1 Tax=Bradyrhizobium sp. CCBAU 11434 TaxID=1630885 RepID=UPI0023068500|nr:hypothetical protein [Bradyrhizobium sp. CCBAU 11434]